jgi:hypothetical protein
MNKIVKTALTCRICGFVTETTGNVDVSDMKCMACSTAGEYMIRNFTEREYQIQKAERKMQSLKKAIQHINLERALWEKRLRFYLSDKYDNMLRLEADGDEMSDRELTCFLENIDGI